MSMTKDEALEFADKTLTTAENMKQRVLELERELANSKYENKKLRSSVDAYRSMVRRSEDTILGLRSKVNKLAKQIDKLNVALGKTNARELIDRVFSTKKVKTINKTNEVVSDTDIPVKRFRHSLDVHG